MSYPCPKCGAPMQDYVSFLAPTYLTYVCPGCGGIFYDLVDAARLKEIQKEMVLNAVKKLKDKHIAKALEGKED